MPEPLRVTGLNVRLIAEHAARVRDQELKALHERKQAAAQDPEQRNEMIRQAGVCAYLMGVYQTCLSSPPQTTDWDSVLVSVLCCEVSNLAVHLQNAAYRAVQDPTTENVRCANLWRRDFPASLDGQTRGYRRLAGELRTLPLQPATTPGT